MNSSNYFHRLSRLSKNALVIGKQTAGGILLRGKSRSERLAKQLAVPLTERIHESVQFLDNALGVSEVVEAQENVSAREAEFLDARTKVEQLQIALAEQQEQLNEARKTLDRTDRADEKYLACVSEEHKILLQVQKLRRLYESAENVERQQFMSYSSAVRLSHEKERTRVERTKYWSIIASVSGTVLGFLLSSLVTQYRLSRIKDVTTSSMKDTSDRLESRLLEYKDAILEETSTVKDLILAESVESRSNYENSSNEDALSTKGKHTAHSITQKFEGILSQYEEVHRGISSSAKSLEQTVLDLKRRGTGDELNSENIIEDIIKTHNKEINSKLSKLQQLVTGNRTADFEEPIYENNGTISVQSVLNVNNLNLLLAFSTFAVVVYSAIGRS